ncbi:MAG: hypothetical protein GXO25_04150 [Euryarchaeota archaeon]|nr:hypothetical protein [Euryarchaeota archaeon]
MMWKGRLNPKEVEEQILKYMLDPTQWPELPDYMVVSWTHVSDKMRTARVFDTLSRGALATLLSILRHPEVNKESIIMYPFDPLAYMVNQELLRQAEGVEPNAGRSVQEVDA